MKFGKILAILTWVLAFNGISFAGGLDPFKIYLTEEKYPEFAELIKGVGLTEPIASKGLSSKQNKEYDFAVQGREACFNLTEDKMGCNEPLTIMHVFFSTNAKKNAKGEIVQEEGQIAYESKVIGLIFMEPKIAWFASEDAMKAYRKLVIGEPI
ncbi:hypothetical protein HYS99_01710 [Candidatus Giovannonibacteria bacterium]|nr:hypothetical protein [Candidatus Giovannonibacteria bacterium]